MMNFTSEEARILLRNKFVVVLGDSIQRTVYKDLVLFLQKSNHLTDEQLRTKCEQSFEGDCQLEASKPTNSTEFRETRQFCDPFHLLRFHFLTCVYSPYVEEILERFQAEALPDILIINSCVWDISRYGKDSKTEYWKNLEHLFIRLREVLPADCLVIWSLAMPLGSRLKGGFLPSEQEELYRNLRKDVMEANFYAAKLAAAYEFDVLDLHFRFRQRLEQRAADGIHWDEHAHRTITQLLLHHIAEAWGICLPQHRAPVPTSRGVGPRQSGPLRWNGAVENHFTSDLPESSLRYMSFRDAPGPEVQVPWEVGAQGSASRNWNYFRSDLPEPCPPSVRFRNASGPDGPPTARAFAPFSQAMDDPQFWNYSWRLVCNRRVMRRRVNRGRAQEPYKPQLGSSGSLPASILCLQGLLPPESLGHVLCEEELSLCI
ncbi:PC-esterase domain-containing protein 1A isoform X1 [Hemitrygon akajei]|uniref:PC-esterase domain-containing protein 1A isoform X1 n=1 Tax=Hemitrygon akajei TaxID=2704970 RepID=UPI003BF9EB7B